MTTLTILRNHIHFDEFIPAEVPYPGLGYSRAMRPASPAPPRDLAELLMDNRATKAKPPKRMCAKFDEGEYADVIFQCFMEYNASYYLHPSIQRMQVNPATERVRWTVVQANNFIRLISLLAPYLATDSTLLLWNHSENQAHQFTHSMSEGPGFVHLRHELVERSGWAFSTAKKPFTFKES